jgi:hypothetical protein
LGRHEFHVPVSTRIHVDHGHERRGDHDPLDPGAAELCQHEPARGAGGFQGTRDTEVPSASMTLHPQTARRSHDSGSGARPRMDGDGHVAATAQYSLDLLDALQHSRCALDSWVQELLGLHGARHHDRTGGVSDSIDTLDGFVESALLNEVSSAPATISAITTGRACAGRMIDSGHSLRRDPRIEVSQGPRMNARATYPGDVVDEDVVKLALASEELDEVLSLGFGSDGASHAVAGLEEGEGGMSEACVSDIDAS